MMKKTLVTTALLALLGGAAPLALAQTAHDAQHDAQHDAHNGGASAAVQAPLAEGTVKKIDKPAGKLTIAHGPLEALSMPPMTMAFRAAEPALLDQVKVGDRIRFAVERVGGVLTVTLLEPAQ